MNQDVQTLSDIQDASIRVYLRVQSLTDQTFTLFRLNQTQYNCYLNQIQLYSPIYFPQIDQVTYLASNKYFYIDEYTNNVLLRKLDDSSDENTCGFENDTEASHYNQTLYQEDLSTYFDSSSNFSSYSYIIDNTGYPNITTNLERSQITDSLVLTQNIEAIYDINEQYYILSLVFMGVILLLVLILTVLALYYRKKRKQYQQFLNKIKSQQDNQISENRKNLSLSDEEIEEKQIVLQKQSLVQNQPNPSQDNSSTTFILKEERKNQEDVTFQKGQVQSFTSKIDYNSNSIRSNQLQDDYYLKEANAQSDIQSTKVKNEIVNQNIFGIGNEPKQLGAYNNYKQAKIKSQLFKD